MALAAAVMAATTGWCGDEVNGKWWSMNTTRTIGGEHRLVEFSGERFNVWGKRGQAHLKFAQTDILTKVGKDLWTQTVFMFSCRSATGRLIRVTPLLELRDGATNKLLRDFHCSDWPGMDTGSYLEFIFAKYRGTPRLTDCRDLDLHDAVYDPSTKTLKLDFTPGPNAALAVDGKPVAIKGAGRQSIMVRLGS